MLLSFFLVISFVDHGHGIKRKTSTTKERQERRYHMGNDCVDQIKAIL